MRLAIVPFLYAAAQHKSPLCDRIIPHKSEASPIMTSGVGLPPSIQKVAPFQSAPLKFTLEPDMWFQGSQSRTLATVSGS